MHSCRSCIAFRDFVCPHPFSARQFVAHHHEVNAMNRNTLAEDLTSTLLTVDASPIPLRLPIGSAIFAYGGEVWITQERMYDDVILGPGERFDVHSRDLILASATKGAASVYVACTADAAASIEGDLFALLHHRVRRLRAEHFARAVQSTRELLLPGLAAVSAHIRRVLTLSRRLPSH
jgi:Protein of unknown function (DUF2917)